MKLRAVTLLVLLCASASLEAKNRAVRHPGSPVLRFTSGDRSATAQSSPLLDPANAPAMTIEMRLFQTGNVSIFGAAPFARTQGSHPLYAMQIQATGPDTDVVTFLCRDAKERLVINGAGRPLARRRWVHVALVLDGVSARAYVDGVLYGVETMQGMGRADSSTGPFRIGDRFPGVIRDVRIWQRALPANEIFRVAAGSEPDTQSGLVAFWPLDDGSTQTPRDKGPNNLGLTLGQTAQPEDQDPLWIDSALLSNQPYWDLQFMPPSNLEHGGPAFVVDATGDGLADLGVYVGADATMCNYPYYERIYPSTAFRNTGSGFVEDPTIVDYEISGFERHLVVADLTGDGRQDVLVVDHGPEFYFFGIDCGAPGDDHFDLPGGQSRILVAGTDGKLHEQTLERLPRRIAYDHGYALIDVDGDHDLDLYLSGRNNLDPGRCAPADRVPGSPCPVILMNDGKGFFTEDFTRLPESVASHRDPDAGENASNVERYYLSGQAIDFDRDGDQDLALGGLSLTASGDPYDLLLVNDGTGHFTKAPSNALPVRENNGDMGTVYMDSADFDRDGWPDLLNVQYAGIHTYFNQHDGTFRRVDEALPAHAGDDFGRCRAVDLNADGAVDLLCPSYQSPALNHLPVTLYYNRGNGTFEEMQIIDDLGEGDRVYATDADGDGDLDLMGNLPYYWVAYQRRPYVAQTPK